MLCKYLFFLFKFKNQLFFELTYPTVIVNKYLNRILFFFINTTQYNLIYASLRSISKFSYFELYLNLFY